MKKVISKSLFLACLAAKFFNFEEVVPNKDWGLKQSTQFSSSLEKDYMHFTEEGHIILANKLAESIQP